jgi:ABC-type nitrate/sulfonate/bicarbonate transport system substrate-binding protein
MLAAVAALIAGCWRNEGASTGPKVESVTVALPPVLHSALVLLAVEKRYFAEQGLNVTILPIASGAAAIDALERGQADFALNSETDEARWALARRATAPAASPNFLEFIDARPLQSAVPNAVSILVP